ncbi:MAG: TolC family protein [Pyrinomonadaceae bacterium]|nr:TolC family protein [Pyrinomonadaceae bacterium]
MNFSRNGRYLLLNLTLSLIVAVSATVAQDVVQSPAAGDLSEPANKATAVVAIRRPDRGNVSPLLRVGIQTAQPIPLTLPDAIRRALEKNNAIEVSRGDVRFQETQVRSLLGIYDPVFTLSPNFSRNSTTGNAATRDFRVNSNLFQFIRPGGGDYQVFFNNQRTENAFAQAQVSSGQVSGGGNSAIYSSSLGVTYTQPLARNFRIDSKRQSILIAKKRLEQTDSTFRTLATDTITQVQTTYWDFVFALRNQQNQVANVDLARENLRQVEIRIAAGAAAPLERAEVATELATREGELLLATQQVASTENALKGLILRDPLSNEWSQTFVPTDRPAFSTDPVNLEAALKDAMDNRFDLRGLKIASEMNQIDISFFKNQTKPQIDLNTTFSLDGLSRSGTNAGFTTNVLTSQQDIFLLNQLNATRTALGLPPLTNPPVIVPPSPSFLFGGFNRSLANIFRTDAPNFSVGVTISFPFRNRTAKADLDGARVRQDQIAAQTRGQEQDIIIEVRNAVQAVETTRQRVLKARVARENAEIQLDGERKLYEAGKSTTFLLFQRENALTNARNAEIRAETDHNKAIAELQRVTATSFAANNVVVESPVPINK